MSKLYTAFVLLLLVTAIEARAAQQSSIERVVVYQDRAQVDRQGSVTLASGRNQVSFDGLPAPLMPGSVRARVEDDRVEVIGLTQREEVHLDQRREEVRDLLGQIRSLRTEVREHQVQDGTQQARLEQLGQMREYTRATLARQQMDAEMSVSAFDRTLDLVASDIEAILAERSRLQAAVEELQQEIGALQQRANDLAYGSDRTTTTVTVTLESAAAVAVPLVVSYGVGGVSWSPRYDVRYDDGQLGLAYMAEVRQSSGEDWTDVKLIFTTARPDEMVPPPANQPLYLSGYKEKETTVQLGSLREETDDDWGGVAGGLATSGEDVTVVRRGIAVDLELTRSASVPADGRPYRIAVLEHGLDAEVDLFAAPSLSPHVYLRARTANSTGLPLLDGPVDVFRSSGYVGSFYLSDLAAGEKLDMSLGPAGPVTVTRDFDEQRNRVVERSVNRKKVHFVHDLVVNNYGDEPTEIVVSEAVPVSRVDQVKVTMDDETTTGYETTEDGSILSWTLSLPAGEEKRVHLQYLVDLPEDYAWEGF